MDTRLDFPIRRFSMLGNWALCVAPFIIILAKLLVLALSESTHQKVAVMATGLGVMLILFQMSALGWKVWLIRLLSGPRAFVRGPGVVITDQFIRVHLSIVQPVNITWDCVTDIQRVPFTNVFPNSTEGIAVFVDSPASLHQRATGLEKLLVNLNTAVSGSPIYISTDNLRVNQQDLYEQLMARFDPSFVERRHRYAPRPEYLVPYQDTGKE